MLHFFRKIRKKLLLNKSIRTYTFYAIGEILLVVIGILIALQVNNWNERRVLENELHVYLEKKLDDLNEDQKQLNRLYEYRVKASQLSRHMLNIGLLNAPADEVFNYVRMITVERRFISAIQKNQGLESNTYFKDIKESKINDLEIEYQNMIDLVTFDEFRLNNFSEELEADLWRKGFFFDNKEYFRAQTDLQSARAIELTLTESNGLKSLQAIIQRNEISNFRISERYAELRLLNQELTTVIQDYLKS